MEDLIFSIIAQTFIASITYVVLATSAVSLITNFDFEVLVDITQNQEKLPRHDYFSHTNRLKLQIPTFRKS